MPHERVSSLSSLNKENLGIRSLNVDSLGGPADPMPTLETPYVRRVKAGSSEDFHEDTDGMQFALGKKLARFVTVKKTALGIVSLDLKELGPPADTLPSIDTPATRRIKAGSAEDFEESHLDISGEEEGMNEEEMAPVVAERRKSHGDSAVTGEFKLPKLDVKVLGSPKDPMPCFETPFTRRVRNGSNEDFAPDESLHVPDAGFTLEPFRHVTGASKVRGQTMSYEDVEETKEGIRKDRGDSVAVLGNFLLSKLDVNDLGGPVDPVPGLETRFNVRVKNGSTEDFNDIGEEVPFAREQSTSINSKKAKEELEDYTDDEDEEGGFRIRLDSIAKLKKDAHGITVLNVASLGGPADPVPTMDTPFNRRMKAGSSEVFENEADVTFRVGKKLSRAKIGLGVTDIDISTLGPPADALPSIETPATRRVKQGSTEDFHENEEPVSSF